jgi:hypothetical protein
MTMNDQKTHILKCARITPLMMCSILAIALSACSSSPFSSSSAPSVAPSSAISSGGGNVLSNLFFYGGTTVPAPALDKVVDELDCPPIIISDGGAALRLGGSDSQSVRQQITINNIARECAPQGQGGKGVIVKAGAQGFVLLGPSGSSGTYSTAVKFVAKRGDKVIASQVQRVSVTIPAGQSQASFVAIAQGLVIPAPLDDVKIEAGLEAGGGASPARKKRR